MSLSISDTIRCAKPRGLWALNRTGLVTAPAEGRLFRCSGESVSRVMNEKTLHIWCNRQLDQVAAGRRMRRLCSWDLTPIQPPSIVNEKRCGHTSSLRRIHLKHPQGNRTVSHTRLRLRRENFEQ